MSTCCVSGCKYRYTPGSNIKLYRIPSGSRPYHANKRRLWLEAIQRANGSTEPIKDTARVCSAHFISGEASMEYGMPDFVPSVFTCAERSATPKKKVRWSLRTAKVRVEEKTTPPEVDSPVDLQSSVLMETETELLMETQTPSTPSVPKEEETSTKQAENETRAVQLQTSNTNMPSPSFKAPAGIAKLLLRSPIVLLKPIVSPAGGYQCDQCNLTFPIASQLIKHKQLHEEQKSLICAKCFPSQTDLTEHHAVHEEEPSFPCNICDRSFPTSRSLKRHKLLHVRDGRKCLTCGALFCRRHRHRHLSFLPKIECKTGSEEESSIIEQQHVGSNLIPENDLPNQSIEESVPGESSPVPDESSPGPSKSSPVPDESSPGPSKSSPVPGESSPVSDNTQNTQIFTLLLTSSTSTSAATPSTPTFSTKTCNAPHPPLHTSDLPKIPTRVLPEPSSMPPPPPPPAIIRYKGQGTSFKYRSSVPATFNQPQCPELPPSLKIFSPQYLTSALLEVKRNYEYIFSKSKDVKMKPTVKEEPAEPLMVSKDEQTITNKKERISYDLYIVL